MNTTTRKGKAIVKPKIMPASNPTDAQRAAAVTDLALRCVIVINAPAYAIARVLATGVY